MVIALVLFTVFKQFDGRGTSAQTVTYTQFMTDAQAGRINKVDIQGDTIYVTPDAGRPYSLTSPGDRKSVVQGKSVSVRVDLGGRRSSKKKTEQANKYCNLNIYQISN